jgi:hypothetical protein CLOST_1278
MYRDKAFRALEIYDRLRKGEKLLKEKLANEYGVSLKTIQRDIVELRHYLYEKKNEIGEFEIKVENKCYVYKAVAESDTTLTQQEILAVCKILLESRALTKNEMIPLIKKFQKQLSYESKREVDDLILDELHHYIELQHGKDLLESLWNLSIAIREKKLITFDYTRMDKRKTKKEVKPAAIMFSEYYFYLISYGLNVEEDMPLVFRVDRMSNIKYGDERFYIPYKDRFEDGEFRKRIQFMYSGKLKKFTFEFSGPSLEAVLDRLPTSKVIKTQGKIHTITAECYGDGIKMWLNSQGENVKIIEEREI